METALGRTPDHSEPSRVSGEGCGETAMTNHNTLRPVGIGILGLYVALLTIGVIEVILH